MRVYSDGVINKGLFTKGWAGCEDTTRDSAASRTGNCGAVTTPGPDEEAVPGAWRQVGAGRRPLHGSCYLQLKKKTALVTRQSAGLGLNTLPSLSPPSSDLLVLPQLNPTGRQRAKGPILVHLEVSFLGPRAGGGKMEIGFGRMDRRHPALLYAHFLATCMSGT